MKNFHKAKKSLGQNFLKSEIALKKIIETGDISQNDTILEIGPGKGALTKKLLEKAGKVIAVEKDRELVTLLEEKFKEEINNKKLILIEDDILNINIEENISYKLIANIPYNITGAIFKKFLTTNNQPQNMILLVQKEVAQRICSKESSILSLSVKAYGEPKYIMKVSKKYFSPSPKVDSAIISIKNISKNNFKDDMEEKLFFEIIKAGFIHKRKILSKNLESVFEKEKILKTFKEINIKEKARAQDLDFTKWLELFKKLKN